MMKKVIVIQDDEGVLATLQKQVQEMQSGGAPQIIYTTDLNTVLNEVDEAGVVLVITSTMIGDNLCPRATDLAWRVKELNQKSVVLVHADNYEQTTYVDGIANTEVLVKILVAPLQGVHSARKLKETFPDIK